MRKLLFIFALVTFGCYSQQKLDAEQVAQALIGCPKDSVYLMMKGAEHIRTELGSDIFYVYSIRDGKNIPLEFYYTKYSDNVLRVYRVEFVSRKSKYSKVTDLRTAFWLEYIRNPHEE